VQAHPRVGAQGPGKLARADIDGVHVCGARLQHGVGKAAGRGPDIEADFAGEVDREPLQRARQFAPAAADVRRPREHLEDGIGGHRLAGFGGFLAIEQDLAGHDEGLGLLARFRQPALHQQTVETGFHGNNWPRMNTDEHG
jgi:hypothetical protein